jgi:hypothetical protein
MDTQTQNQHIYQWLLAGKSITTLEAMLHHGIGRLASRICDLIKDYNVPICKEREPNSDGKGYHTRYWMSKEDRDKLQNIPLSKVHKV